jgi:formate hydrogenlyase transcriptional activator
VLQEHEIERVGSNKPIPVDVRVLSATHRDLNALVAEGKFRQDLMYRLNVVPIEMPSLRERAADIPLLVEYFIDSFGKKIGKKFRKTMANSISTLLLRNLSDVFGESDSVRRRAAIEEIFHDDAVFYDSKGGVFRGREEIDRIAGEIKATHPDFKYQLCSAKSRYAHERVRLSRTTVT